MKSAFGVYLTVEGLAVFDSSLVVPFRGAAVGHEAIRVVRWYTGPVSVHSSSIVIGCSGRGDRVVRAVRRAVERPVGVAVEVVRALVVSSSSTG